MDDADRPVPRASLTASELSIGQRVEVPYAITEDDVSAFATLSGDYNPIHFDESFASHTIFRRKIAHGIISLAKFSGIFGMQMPGLGTLWECQEVRFIAPVFIGEQYRAIAEVTSITRNRAMIDTWVENQEGSRVLEGRAEVIPITHAQRSRLAVKGLLPTSTD